MPFKGIKVPKYISKIKPILLVAFSCMFVCLLAGCASSQKQEETKDETESLALNEEKGAESQSVNEEDTQSVSEEDTRQKLIDDAYSKLNISNDFRSSFVHGNKGSEYQKYIVLHDTEGTEDASSVIDWWDSNGNLVAAHFIINKDGSIVQCAPLDSIVHHAGFGDTGHNELYGVEDESRDDKAGTTPIGSWASDYGMNSYSVGIEMVHIGGSEDYPEAQLEALDDLIAYIDAYYGFESEIIDHKAWRSGNSDTSPEFAEYFENFKNYRTHRG
ncbi:N-acetylmuramoyl-L-alanine amidase [Eggerthella sp. YY7918]|uniref:N-acetylmuramoyl-L-alanine amidase n=1 Tax=Eggerthella sp. (strain YY7918) TaxID=502558 RepID=UPI00021718AC|nr:N-acetylmuramoyl-L-alanine amidase [Eggerthella sp. YY7918]BAK44590.1 hypothetical protein EGYY_14400 [Eggerthella sp. YY7918]